MGALRRAGQPRGAVQGRAGLHRPRLPRAGRGPARPQPRPGAGRRAADRPAVPARQRGADIAVVEGVMGLFDGRIGDARPRRRAGSTAHVAALLGAPVVLVVDAAARATASAALLHGFSTFDRGVRTRRGDPQPGRLARGTRRCCARRASRSGCRCSASMPRADELAVPSRHLGLVTAVEHGRARRRRGRGDDRAGGRARRPGRGGRRSRPAMSSTNRWTPRRGRSRAPTASRRRARCGQGVHLRLRRAPRAAARRRRATSSTSTRCTTRCRRHRRAGAARRVPRAVHCRAVGQRRGARSRSARSPPPVRRCTPSARA